MGIVQAAWRVVVPLLFVPALAFAQPAPVPVAPQPTTVEGATAHVYNSIDGTSCLCRRVHSGSGGFHAPILKWQSATATRSADC